MVSGVNAATKRRKMRRVSTISRPASPAERIAFGRLIRQLVIRRKEMGLSQNDLDVAMGVAIGQVAKWEVMDRIPGAFLLACWVSALDLRLEPMVFRRK